MSNVRRTTRVPASTGLGVVAALLSSAAYGQTPTNRPAAAPVPSIAASRPGGALSAAETSPGLPERLNACGDPVAGEVNCTTDDPLDEGAYYPASGDLTVHLEDGLVVAPTPDYAGIIAVSDNGRVVLDGPSAGIKVENASGIYAETVGDIVIDLASVSAVQTDPSRVTRGIEAISSEGTTDIRVGDLRTTGDYATGILTESSNGSIFIDAGHIATNGFSSDAIAARTGGQIDIHAGTIESTGDYNWGVNVFNGVFFNDELATGYTNVDVDTIRLSGSNNVGINLLTYSDASVRVGELQLDGIDNLGVLAAGLGSVSVDVGTATFTGKGGGILASGEAGGAFVRIGTLTTEDGGGVQAASSDGNAVIEAGSVHTNGDFGYAIGAGTIRGSAAVNTGDVSTNGLSAVGIDVDALKGSVSILAQNISTTGADSSAVRAFGRTNTLVINGRISTLGSESYGVLTSTTGGDARVIVKGDVATEGEASDGLWVVGRYGTAQIVTSGVVTTSGDRAEAIHAEGENGQVNVQAAHVATSGQDSDGIRARTRYVEVFRGQGAPNNAAFSGDIDILAGTVAVSGDNAVGISARGLGDARIIAGDVGSARDYAIETNMIGDVALDLRGTIRSATTTAVLATGADLSITIGGGGKISGAVHGITINAVGPRCVLPNPEDGVSPNPCPNPGDEFSDFGNTVGVPQFGLGGHATVTNAGSIDSGTGYAVNLLNGTITLDNRGLVTGAVKFAGGDDRFLNGGTFALGKDSDFGDGFDSFSNSGVVRLMAPTVGAVQAYRMLGLERFDNMGTIDLTSGLAGDVLTLAGDYSGAGNAALRLEVDPAANRSDQLVIEGNAVGSTSVRLVALNGAGALTSADGIALVKVAGTAATNAFVLDKASSDSGFVHYSLGYDAAAKTYRLTGRAGAAAYRAVATLEAAGNLWESSADLWQLDSQTKRDSLLSGHPAADRGNLWGSLQGGRIDRNVGSGTSGLDYRQSRFGAQLGYDLLSKEIGLGTVAAGLTAGYVHSTLDYGGVADQVELASANAGLYASLVGHGIFANLLVKYDRHDVEAKGSAFAKDTDFKGSTLGAEGEVGIRLGGAGMFIEPTVGLAWTRTSFDDLLNAGQRLRFGDASSLKARLGARFGGTSTLANGNSLTLYLSGNLAHRFGNGYSAELVSGASQALILKPARTFGEGRVGLSYRTTNGFQLFLEGEGHDGSGYRSLAGKAGFRLGF